MYIKQGGTTARNPYRIYTAPVENGAPSMLSTELTRELNEAMFSNSCPFLDRVYKDLGESFNMTECLTFGGGVLKQGLAAATDEWLNNALSVADRQLRGIFIVDHLFEGECKPLRAGAREL